MTKIKSTPAAILNQPVSAIANYDWDECYPVVANGVVVGVQTGEGDVLAGVAGKVFDGPNEQFSNDQFQLLRSDDAEFVRYATDDEVRESLNSGQPEGHITVEIDGEDVTCYVQ